MSKPNDYLIDVNPNVKKIKFYMKSFPDVFGMALTKGTVDYHIDDVLNFEDFETLKLFADHSLYDYSKLEQHFKEFEEEAVANCIDGFLVDYSSHALIFETKKESVTSQPIISTYVELPDEKLKLPSEYTNYFSAFVDFHNLLDQIGFDRLKSGYLR